MKRSALALAGVIVLVAATVRANGPETLRRTPDKAPSLGDVTPTQDMWFYQQSLQQYQDPKAAVRRKAEFRSEARDRRLAALKWFGMSNSRPQANGDLLDNDYSPRWTSNNPTAPDQWMGVGPSCLIVPVERAK